MADLSDVENQLKAMLVGWIYPNGTTQPSAITLDGVPVACKVGRGWPVKTQLQADLAANVCNISIYSAPGSERLTTRYPKDWHALSVPVSTTTMTVSGETITLGGSITPGGVVAAIVNGMVFAYAAILGDTVTSAAAALAALIDAEVAATSSGSVITITGAYNIKARVGVQGTAIRELRRQERLWQISAWCNTPEQRDAVAIFVDGKFAGVGEPDALEFIPLPDGTAGRFKYVRTLPIDKDELSGSFRRDLVYSVEYATTDTMTGPTVVAFETRLVDQTGFIILDKSI